MAITMKPVSPSQGAWRLDLPCSSNSPSEGEPGGRPKPRKSSEVRVVIEEFRMKGRKVSVATVALGRRWRQMIVPSEKSERARGVHIFEVARPQKFRAHDMHERNPGEEQQYAEQDKEARGYEGGDDDQQIKLWQRRPDFNEALRDQIDPSAEIALHGARGDADHRRDGRKDKAEQHRDAKAVEQACDDVATLVVGAKPVPFDVATAAVGRAGRNHFRRGRLALRLGQEPGRRRRRRRREIEIVRVIGEADGGPDHKAMRVDLLGDRGIAIVRMRVEAAELSPPDS